MNNYKLFFLLSLLIMISHGYSQTYRPIAKPDTTRWLFAHKQLAGKLIDTLLITDDSDTSLMKLLYHGTFYSRDTTLVGFIEISNNNDKIWYYTPEDTLKFLVFDLDLLLGEEFDFTWASIPAIVDSVYVQDARKIIQFNFDTDWNEPVKFIEGIGPNVTFMKWKTYGFLSPIVVCSYDLDELKYENSNPSFNNCDLNYSSDNSMTEERISASPNPFGEYLIINSSQKNSVSGITCSLYSIVGQKILEFWLAGDSRIELNTSKLKPGIYILQFSKDYYPKPIKLIKHEKCN